MTATRMNRRGFAILTGSAAAASVVGAAPAPASQDAAGTANADARVPRLVRRWATAWNTGDAQLMAALFTRNGTYTDHAFQASFRGPEAIGQWVVITLDTIANARVTVHDAFRTGTRAAVRWTFAGTFKTIEPFPPGNDPRGKSFSVPAMSFFTLAEGRICAVEDFYNLADLMRQLGLSVPYSPPS